MLYLQGLLKVHRYGASEAKCVSRLGTISHYQELKKISREILLFLVNLQTHGHIVTGFFLQSKAKSFAVAENALTFKMHRVVGCTKCPCITLSSLSLAE